ncbi:MAG: PKD domain-containing protein, partial [Gammaproteobacteria bacterium]
MNRLKSAQGRWGLGPDQTVRGGTTVTLDGTASSDSDGTIAASAWRQTAGTPVTLAGADRATASFSSPLVNTEETLMFTLIVTDDGGASAADSVPVTLLPNAAPTAAVGNDQTVLGGSLVTLDGSGSHDTDGQVVSALWRQEAGTPVILIDADTAIASFTAPRSAGEEPLHFSLTVTDDSGASASDEITIIVLANQPPLADAGLDQSVTAGSFVPLNAEGSSDPEGGPLNYRWQQSEGVPVDLTGSDTSEPSFTAPSPAADQVLGFTLTVTD